MAELSKELKEKLEKILQQINENKIKELNLGCIFIYLNII